MKAQWFCYQPLVVSLPTRRAALRSRLAGWKAGLLSPLRRRQWERQHGIGR